MRDHHVIEKSAGYKNKVLAQNFGIAIAQDWFNEMLDIENQSFRFYWKAPKHVASLGINYKKEPKNYNELKEIALQSAEIEFENLKLAHKGKLPTKIFTEHEIIENSVDFATKSSIIIAQMEFYKKHDVNDKDFKHNHKKMFVEAHTVDDLKKYGYEQFEKLTHERMYTEALKVVIIKKINTYYESIVDLYDFLYGHYRMS